MIADVESFLRYFDGIHRRTVRDVSALPSEAETWRPPPSPDQEASWGAPEIVRHVAEARSFFASAFLGHGWVWDPWPDQLFTKESWVPALEASRDRLLADVTGAPSDRLTSRVEALGAPDRTISGWRTLMMMIEHEVHHRSQLDTYGGLNGWPVPQIFGRTSEWVAEQADIQRSSQRQGP